MIDKPFWIKCVLFPGFYYGFCPSEKAWYKEFKRIGFGTIPTYPKSDGNTFFFDDKYADVKGNCALVTINNAGGKESIVIAGLLAHEAVHIKQAILRSVGEDNVGDETEAYLIQTITQDLLWAYHDRILK